MTLEPAIEIIKKWEGFSLTAYLDSVGIPTIGYGHIHAVKMGDICTEEQALKWLNEEVKNCARNVEYLVKAPISNNAKCALVSFTYNLGYESLKKSTLLIKLNSGYLMPEVAHEFLKWCHAGGKIVQGLVNRRKDEMALFLS